MSGPTIVVLGVSGSGKTTVGALLAVALEAQFVDADSLHSEANRLKMIAVGAALAKGNVVIACSALRRRYRDQLRRAAPDLRLIYLRGSRALLRRRLAGRQHEFLPQELLDSQLDTLESPAEDEHAIVTDIDRSPSDIAMLIVNELRVERPEVKR